MKHLLKLNPLLAIPLLALVLSACVTEEVKPKFMTRPPMGGANFPKLSNYRLALYPVGKRDFTEGRAEELNLCLKNIGETEVKIVEWHMNTPDNINIYYRPYEAGIDTFEPTGWKRISPEIKPDAYRFQLTLHPGNSVFVTTMIPLRKIKETSASDGRYLMAAELNLKSISLRSSIFEISIK